MIIPWIPTLTLAPVLMVHTLSAEFTRHSLTWLGAGLTVVEGFILKLCKTGMSRAGLHQLHLQSFSYICSYLLLTCCRSWRYTLNVAIMSPAGVWYIMAISFSLYFGGSRGLWTFYKKRKSTSYILPMNLYLDSFLGCLSKHASPHPHPRQQQWLKFPLAPLYTSTCEVEYLALLCYTFSSY